MLGKDVHDLESCIAVSLINSRERQGDLEDECQMEV